MVNSIGKRRVVTALQVQILEPYGSHGTRERATSVKLACLVLSLPGLRISPLNSIKSSNLRICEDHTRVGYGTRTSSYLSTMLAEISHVDIASDTDACVWSLFNDGIFSHGVTLRHIDDCLLPSLDPPTLWDKTLPRKVNMFMWRLRLDRLQHRLNISYRGGKALNAVATAGAAKLVTDATNVVKSCNTISFRDVTITKTKKGALSHICRAKFLVAFLMIPQHSFCIYTNKILISTK
ncbi:hypothetical protein Tco_0285511 [Tanacetum coccineum]